MEMRKNAESDEMLQGPWTMCAGGASVATAAAAAVMLITNIPGDGQRFSAEMIWFALLMGLAAGVAVGGVGLLRRRIWAQRMMLAFWLIAASAAILTGAAAIVWRQWWSEAVPARLGSVGAWSLICGAAAVGASISVMLIVSARRRLRYASIVSLAAAAAVSLTVLVNIISQRDYYRVPIESLGRYSISQRTEGILADLDKPVSLTCVYTGSGPGEKGADFRPRVMELLQDIREKADKLGKQIRIASVTTDAQRKAEDIRLGSKQRRRYGAKHEKFIRDFRSSAGEITEELKARQIEWRELAKDSYLAQWPVPAPLSVRMSRLIEGFDRTRIMLRSELDHEGIRNYPALVGPAKSVLASTRQSLTSYRATIAAIEAVHRGAIENRKKALDAVTACVGGVSNLAAIVGKNSDPAPSDPDAVIKAFIAAAAKASENTHKATVALETIAGAEHATLVVNSSQWVIKTDKNKMPLTEFFGKMSKSILLLARRNQQIVQISTAKFKAEEVIRLRKQLATMQIEFSLAGAAAIKALDALTSADAKSRKIMSEASNETLFAGVLTQIEALAKQADELPEIEAASLTKDLAEDNIVIVEAGDKVEVVSFDEVWPVSMLADSQGRPRREFNGNSAIGSRICSITNEPFATVILAYVQPLPTAEMKKKNQLFANPTVQYKTLTARLKAANLEVRNWEISKPLDEAVGDPTSAPAPGNAILIVLPSINQAEITDVRMTNLKREIDKGTPAVFLTESQIKPAGTDAYDKTVTDYLAGEWGISVMSDYVVIPAVRDSVDPTQFKIDNLRNRHMPQSSFSPHVIGKGLRGQRLLWRALSTCPVKGIDANRRPDVAVSSVLTVPPDQTATWATARFIELQKQYRTTEGGFIRPDFAADESPDIKPPFDLAVAASRKGAAGRKPNRIVVLGVGASLSDGYIAANVEVHASNRTTSMAAPPLMDADLVVNSVLWLGGLEDRIAAGPAVSKPIDVQPHVRDLLMTACAIGLPLAVLAAGGAVMLARKRR